jgi:hypothetical protein
MKVKNIIHQDELQNKRKMRISAVDKYNDENNVVSSNDNIKKLIHTGISVASMLEYHLLSSYRG